MDSFKDVLEAAQSYCKAQMAEPTYNLYIDGLEPISFEDSSHITLSVRNDFICKIVTDRYLGLLKEAFKTVLGFDVDITLVVPSTPPHEVVLAQQYEANPASPQGNYEFTFENFIKGPSNQFAFAAAQAVAANPSGAYNPLFIYGGSGLVWRLSAGLNALVTARSTNTQIWRIAPSMTRKENITVTMQEKSTPTKCPTSTCSVPDFLAKASRLRENGLDSKTQEELCSLKLPDSLQPNGLHFFFWKTSRDCYRMTGARRLKPSTPRLLKWGIILNGVCITADISESPSSDGACILSDILIPDVPDKYFLSAAAMRRISGNLSAAPRGKGFTIPTE